MERTGTRNAVKSALFVIALVVSVTADAGPREQAKRIHDRIAGVPPVEGTLADMADIIEFGGGGALENGAEAAMVAMDHPEFYRTTLKNFAAPWTNRDQSIFEALNDYTATIIGMVRDDVDFREVLTGSTLYVGEGVTGVPAYSPSNNSHYEALERDGVDLAQYLVARNQIQLTGIPADATAGVMTSRAAARAFFIAGTNRAMFRFTLMSHLCVDLEQVADTTRAPDRIRQDVTRSPGGDSRVFRNNCVGCHAGMDPMAQAFAFYNYDYDPDSDPEGLSGQLTYNSAAMVDPATGSRVVAKHHINGSNFALGFVTGDDQWDNYWRAGRNQVLGWDMALPGSGQGARSLGEELANSNQFAQCQVTKVFRAVCLRDPVDSADRNQVASMVSAFEGSGYQLKRPFADAAAWCMGE